MEKKIITKELNNDQPSLFRNVCVYKSDIHNINIYSKVWGWGIYLIKNIVKTVLL